MIKQQLRSPRELSIKRNTWLSIGLSLLLGGLLGSSNAASHVELIVTMGGAGSGRVTSAPDGIFCQPDCAQTYPSGTQLTLTAVPYSGSVFTGWSGGGCNGTGACTLTLDDDTTVSADFDLIDTGIDNLITPYVNQLDMNEISNGFNSDADDETVPWDIVHDGFDIYPQVDLSPFQAVCSGRVHWMYTGSEQVTVMLACNSTYTAEYNFETQEPQTGQIQLADIAVVEGQVVSKGDIIGNHYAPNPNAHVHFAFYRNWIPSCPEPYLSPAARDSILDLLRVNFSNVELCYGGDITPQPLVTPYRKESDMLEIAPGFSSDDSISPWGISHKGLDIYPQGDQKAFQAACAGVVDSVNLTQPPPQSNWQVEVVIQCDDYVIDLMKGGYFVPFVTEYIFRPMSSMQHDGVSQRENVLVVEGQTVSQGELIGYLDTGGRAGAHVQFDLALFGSSTFRQLGVQPIPVCPEPHFSTQARDSVLSLLHIAWPSANLCYQAQVGQVPETVLIDVKPGSDRNAINPRSRGVTPVAVLTTQDFDATSLDPSAVQFGPDGATIGRRSVGVEDVDGDGDLDLLLRFPTPLTGIVCGTTEVVLTGQTFFGTPIQGMDSVVTVGCKKK